MPTYKHHTLYPHASGRVSVYGSALKQDGFPSSAYAKSAIRRACAVAVCETCRRNGTTTSAVDFYFNDPQCRQHSDALRTPRTVRVNYDDGFPLD